MDEYKLYIQYPNQVTKILILYDEDYPSFEVEKNEDNRTFYKFEYKNKVLDEAKGFYTSKVSDSNFFDNSWKNYYSSAIYLSHMEELLSNKPTLRKSPWN
ncbi:36506_t:CDS:1 [Racocetra persica]|uniref:36506_t:CDS:1 n=1 Tax=Racocetra persica TaxID=160502 RepID=A0ACA9MMM1_9GLOM|nr:36506_t:CDS:1 [Racocetra persica]